MSDTTFIYSLSDPDTGKIRYVGKADKPKERLWEHLKVKGTFHRATWIQSLLKAGRRPVLGVLMEVHKSQWQLWEREWIRILRLSGADLTNSTDGGDGVTNISGDGKLRMRAAHVGRKASPETRARMSAANRGKSRPCPPGRGAAISLAKKGIPMSAKHRAALSAVKKGRPLSQKNLSALAAWRGRGFHK